MGFKIVKGTPHEDWFPISAGTGPTANSVYVGQIVKWQTGGILALGAPEAGPDVTYYPFGIVVALNDRNATWDTTYNTQKGTQVITQATEIATSHDWFGQEGMFNKATPYTLAKVAILDQTCVIEGDIQNAAITTAPGVVTSSTTAITTGFGMVHTAADFTPVANNSTYYCRSGANAGLYNVSNYATSATTPTFYQPWPYAGAVTDTFVVVNVGLGRQKIAFDSTSQWIDNSAALTNYFLVNVLSMKLEVAGSETVQFKFARLGY